MSNGAVLLKVKVIGIRADTGVFIQRVNLLHFLGGQFKIKYVRVLGNPLRFSRLRNRNDPVLQIPAQRMSIVK